ncbi:MAG: M48 family metallopeptidase [Campylobacteraceae bacterium]|nr:M48 family metallopeptidase [Campylobacteraceae bacterium]
MNFDIIINNKTFCVSLEQKNRLKNIYLRILDHSNLQVRANKSFSIDDARDFIRKKESWILKHVNNKKNNSLSEKEYYFLGEIYDNNDENFNLIEFYKNEAEKLLPILVDKQSFLMDLYPSSLKFRNNKSRWGSCSFKNAISLNINLMKFPIDVIEYVVIHELAHIKHKNHSSNFWNFVEIHCKNYKTLDNNLKKY